MSNTIKCSKCGEEIEISEAFKHQIEETVRDEERKKFDVEIEKTLKDAREKASKKIEEQYALEMKNLREDAMEEKERNKKLLTQLEDLNDQMRALRRKDEEHELEMKKKEAVIEEKVRTESRKQVEEEFHLKELEINQKMQAVLKINEDLKRKVEQGSQQTQGEVLELDLEHILGEAFPNDVIEPVAKGVNGADIKQTVMSPKGTTVCGVILWESKRTKNWSEGWITKLKGDARNSGAHISALVSMAMPDGVTHLGFRDGVWVCSHSLVLPAATMLRDTLIKVTYQKVAQNNQGRKADLIYEYITSTQFQQQVEAILESYTEMQTQIQKERIAYERGWKAREGQLQRIVMATASMYGKMQGLAGANSLPTLKGLDFMELDSGDEVESN